MPPLLDGEPVAVARQSGGVLDFHGYLASGLAQQGLLGGRQVGFDPELLDARTVEALAAVPVVAEVVLDAGNIFVAVEVVDAGSRYERLVFVKLQVFAADSLESDAHQAVWAALY